MSADEYYGSEQVKRAPVRYPIKVVRLDIDPERNPFGPRWTATPAHPSASNRRRRRTVPARSPMPPAICRRLPMKPVALSALAGVLLILGFVPASRRGNPALGAPALPVPLVVGRARGLHRPQCARRRTGQRRRSPARAECGRRDLPAGERADSAHAAATAGRGIRRADPARHRRRAGEGRPCAAGAGAHRGSGSPAKRYGGGAASGADEQADAPADKSVPGAKRRYRSC